MEMFTCCSYQRQMAHQISTCYPCTAVDWKPPNRGVVLEPESLGLLLLRERWFHGPQGERPGQAESEAIWISPKMVSVSRNMFFFASRSRIQLRNTIVISETGKFWDGMCTICMTYVAHTLQRQEKWLLVHISIPKWHWHWR